MQQRIEYEGMKRGNMSDEKEPNTIGPDDTVYRYLCSSKRIGSIIGIGGDIAKQLRAETQARIKIGETIPGCDERVITIYSKSYETNMFGKEPVSPAQDALFRVHDKVVEERMPLDDEFDEPQLVTVRLLVPSDQIGCVIGKGGHVIQNLRNQTRAQIRILGSDYLPPCALNSDELIQITGDASVVKNALYQVAFRLHDNPSRSQHLLLSYPSIYRSGISFNNTYSSCSLAGATSTKGNYKTRDRDLSSVAKEFLVRLVCPTENIGALIGRGGWVIKQIRQESGAHIIVDSDGADEDDCIVSVSAPESFEYPSRNIDAVMLLQPLCSRKIERDSGDPTIVTRLLVSSSSIGCVIGRGGAIIREMRNVTKARIRIFDDENIPRVAAEDDEMVQITGDENSAKKALLLVMQQLRANVFATDGSSSSMRVFDGSKDGNLDNRMNYPAHSGGYNSKTLPMPDNHRSYDESQIVRTSGYGTYAVHSDGHFSGASRARKADTMHDA